MPSFVPRCIDNCEMCGEQIYIVRCNYLKYTHHFCSRTCASHFIKPPIWNRSREEKSEMFWSKVDKTPGLGPEGTCWEWIGSLNEGGYGFCHSFTREFKTPAAHRIAWMLINGIIDDPTDYVCHRCDNRKCVRPEHLFLGKHMDNVKDMLNKGRNAKGSMFKRALLNENLVYFIRYLNKDSANKLGPIFNVLPSTIRECRKGKTWRHVTEDYFESVEDVFIPLCKDPNSEDWIMLVNDAPLMRGLESQLPS